MAPSRVLNIITRLEQGGAPLALLETVSRMNREEFDITVVAGQTEDANRDLDVTLTGFDLPLLEVPMLRRSVHPVRDFLALVHLIRIIRAGNYDLVHTHTSKAGVLGRMAASICRVPAIVHSSHGTILNGYFSPTVTRVFAFFEKLSALVSDQIICLTRAEIDEFLEAGIGKEPQFTFIFNGIDLTDFESRKGSRQELREELGYSTEDVVCVNVARLVPVKGLSDLLEAFALAKAKAPNLKLLIVGDGELRKDLENQIMALGLSDDVCLLGWRDDVAELLDACDLFVLTSLNEGLGLVLLEAMAKKLPVVATSVGGVPEVVDHEVTGSLVPPRDEGAIAAALADLAEDGNKRQSMGQRAYERAKSLFSIDQTVQHTEDLYRRLITT